MRLAHVRERHARPARRGGWQRRSSARRRHAGSISRSLAVAPWRRDPRVAHDAALFRQPVTTLDDHLARGLRIAAFASSSTGSRRADEDDDALADREPSALRAAGPAPAVVP